MTRPGARRAHYDLAILGSGPAGATLAHALAGSGARILLVERGERIPREPQNWDIGAVFHDRRYRAKETWTDGQGRQFQPGIHYCVGGNSKVYAAVMLRLRREDFGVIDYEEGRSPAWPFDYDTLAPYYDRAERLFGVHGSFEDDPTEPRPRPTYPHPAVGHEPAVESARRRLRDLGLHPFPLPLAIDLHQGGTCQRCSTCDAFPCRVGAKGDAETRCVDAAVAGGVELRTGTLARRLLASPDGRKVEAVELQSAGERYEIGADQVAVCCGAINSAALLLRSAGGRHPAGLANGSGQVGRNYMAHNSTALLAIDPRRTNDTRLQKTLGLHDYYFARPGSPATGSIQTLGKIKGEMLRPHLPWAPGAARDWLAAHSLDWWIMSEDLPSPDNRVVAGADGSVALHWTANNIRTHRAMVGATKRLVRTLGYRASLTKTMGIAVTSHQCGTVRFGTDPAHAPLDPHCRAFDLDNLHVVDASVFPSSAAVNPTLTIVALALRVADQIRPSTAGSRGVAGRLI
jgi:choline dehydrogenase-like flavoprotein